jgi:hypothetical protein
MNHLYAQTDKGGVLLGGTAGFQVQFTDPESTTNVELSPQLGFFIDNNLAIGGALNLNFAKSGETNASTFGIAPFGRYYFEGEKSRLFVQAQVGYLSTKFDLFGDAETISGTQIGFGPGIAIFLNDHVAIEGILAYNILGGDFSTNHLGLRFGVQAYLGVKE